MGVMSCYRKDCGSIMCDTYVDDVGYVCSDCQEEFKDFLKSRGISNITEKEMVRLLKYFIQSPKCAGGNHEMDVDEFFRQYTR